MAVRISDLPAITTSPVVGDILEVSKWDGTNLASQKVGISYFQKIIGSDLGTLNFLALFDGIGGLINSPFFVDSSSIYGGTDCFITLNTNSHGSSSAIGNVNVGQIGVYDLFIESSTNQISMATAEIFLYHATEIKFNSSSYVFANLSANKVAVINGTNQLSSSSVTTTTLSYLDLTSSAQTQLNGKEPTINAGITSQYWRGDKTFQTITTVGTITSGVWQGTNLDDSRVAFTDITTGNCATTQHGYLKKLSGSATQYMDGSGAWSIPTGTTYTASNGISLSSGNFTLNNSYFNGDITISAGVTAIGAGKVLNSMITSVVWSKITSTPTTLSGYAITDAQPLDSDLTTIAGLTATTDNFIVSVSSSWASRTPSQVRTTLGLVIGTNIQAYDADLTSIAALSGSAGFLKTDGAGSWFIDTSTYLTSNQSITLSGDISGSGTTAITTAIGNGKVLSSMIQTSVSLTTPILGVSSSTSQTITGTGGLGFIELQTQSSSPSISSTNCVRIFSSAGWVAWKYQNDGFVRKFDGTLTADRTTTLPDYSGINVLSSAAGSNGQVLQSNSTSTPSWSTPTYPSTSGSAGQILRSDGTNNIYSTLTLPNTAAASTILYASSANIISALPTANNGILSTSNSGVPSISSQLTYTTSTGVLANTLSTSGAISTDTINGNTGTAGIARITVQNSSKSAIVDILSTGYTTSGIRIADTAEIIASTTGGLNICTTNGGANAVIRLAMGLTTEIARFDTNGLNFTNLLNSITFSAANKMAAQTTLVAGTRAITITGLTTSHRGIVTLVTPNTTALTTTYQAVCSANTLTIQANVAAGTINVADISTLNYFIFLNN